MFFADFDRLLVHNLSVYVVVHVFHDQREVVDGLRSVKMPAPGDLLARFQLLLVEVLRVIEFPDFAKLIVKIEKLRC